MGETCWLLLVAGGGQKTTPRIQFKRVSYKDNCGYVYSVSGGVHLGYMEMFFKHRPGGS